MAVMTSLRALREGKGKTVDEVAAAVGLSPRHLRRLEAGHAPLRPILARAFAGYYRVPLSRIDEAGTE